MPTHTPSPFRFLPPAPRSTQKSERKAQSTLGHGISAQTPSSGFSASQACDQAGKGKRIMPGKRFIIPPRRSASSGEQREVTAKVEVWGETQNTSRPRPLLSPKVEIIDENSPSSSVNADGQYRDPGDGQTTEQLPSSETPAKEEADDSEEEILFASEETHKRRRISPHPDTVSSPTIRPHPPQTSQAAVPASRRFKFPTQKPPPPFEPESPSATPTPKRPRFIIPRNSPSPSKYATPHPELFSPSRKTNKYVAGGLASTLQSWLIEAAGASLTTQARGREDGVKIKFRISEIGGVEEDAGGDAAVDCVHGSCVFVRGMAEDGMFNTMRAQRLGCLQVEGGDVRVLLMGRGGVIGRSAVRIRVGGLVGIKAPVWDVDVDIDGGTSEKWIVGVEWVVLS